MSDALLRLRESSAYFSPAEKEAARAILADPQMVAELSIHELARRTFSSPSTIVRLCTHTGYSGYRAFRSAVTLELARRDRSRREAMGQIQRTDSPEEIIEKVTMANILALEETRDLMDPDTLRTCVRLLKNSRVIYLFGMGASLCAAKDAYLKFLRLGKLCIINEDWHSQLVQSRNATASDAAVIISYSGETREMIECMQNLKKNRTPMIAITRYVPSPVSALADCCLCTAANEALFRSGAMSSRMAQLNVVDILYTALTNEAYEESIEQLSKTHIDKGLPREE